MADYYAGTWEEVVRFLGQTITVGTGQADMLTSDVVTKFMADVDEEINSILGQVYYVPLRKVKVEEQDVYPDPIPYIAKVLTTSNIISVYYKDISPNESAAVKSLREEAYFRLNALVNDIGAGSRRLRGQKQKARVRFVSPTVVPSKPSTPTSGPAGGIGIT